MQLPRERGHVDPNHRGIAAGSSVHVWAFPPGRLLWVGEGRWRTCYLKRERGPQGESQQQKGVLGDPGGRGEDAKKWAWWRQRPALLSLSCPPQSPSSSSRFLKGALASIGSRGLWVLQRDSTLAHRLVFMPIFFSLRILPSCQAQAFSVKPSQVPTSGPTALYS